MSETAYKYWYEFLKRSEKYKDCCSRGGKGPLAERYKDFGDVHALSWTKWWKTHQDLFADEEPLFVINEVRTNEEFAYLFEEGEDDLLALIVNLNAPKDAIFKEIDKVLRRLDKQKIKRENDLRMLANPNMKMKKQQGRPKFDPSFYHRYGLTPVPSDRDIKALGVMLTVYDACLREDSKPDESKKKKRYEIGEELGIVISPVKNRKDSGEPSTESKRNSMTATVCRYNRWANELIENTEKGIFPRHG